MGSEAAELVSDIVPVTGSVLAIVLVELSLMITVSVLVLGSGSSELVAGGEALG